MRYFYKLAENMVDVVPAMDAVMHRQPHLTNVGDGIDIIQLRDVKLKNSPEMAWFPAAKRLALGVMQAVSGTALGRVDIVRLGHNAKIMDFLASREMAHYIVVLQGFKGSQLLLGDESVELRGGEVWYADMTQEGALMNKSGDDLVLLTIEVQVDK